LNDNGQHYHVSKMVKVYKYTSYHECVRFLALSPTLPTALKFITYSIVVRLLTLQMVTNINYDALTVFIR